METINVMLDDNAKEPNRAHDKDAGMDLCACGSWEIAPRSFGAIPTGVHVEIPRGYVGKLESKSGLMLKGITCRGTIDSGYTGEVKAILFNHSDVKVRFADGDKVTQLVIYPIVTPRPVIVEAFEETERGDNGFGSTGR